jgi:hypothetical protein
MSRQADTVQQTEFAQGMAPAPALDTISNGTVLLETSEELNQRSRNKM